jgi:hypothetical protein
MNLAPGAGSTSHATSTCDQPDVSQAPLLNVRTLEPPSVSSRPMGLLFGARRMTGRAVGAIPYALCVLPRLFPFWEPGLFFVLRDLTGDVYEILTIGRQYSPWRGRPPCNVTAFLGPACLTRTRRGFSLALGRVTMPIEGDNMRLRHGRKSCDAYPQLAAPSFRRGQRGCLSTRNSGNFCGGFQ